MVPERALSHAPRFSYAGAMRSSVWLVVVLVACGGNGKNNKSIFGVDSGVEDSMTPDAPGSVCRTALHHHADCNVLAQTGCAAGEKCTWLIDALSPQYVGHIGCAPDGAQPVGGACMFGAPGATGYDNCVKGTVCSNYRGAAGTCKTICDPQGGAPACATGFACASYSGLFSEGGGPNVAGMCDPGCDPLADNDFDGSGTALTKTGVNCTAPNAGCYGYPSFGTPPKTAWTCTTDINYGKALVHRTQCTDANTCSSGGQVFVNSCNQGYLPLLRESTGVSTVICVALCRPGNTFKGNACNSPAGQAPHACNNTDRRGTFTPATDTTNGEHCTFMWYFEIDDQGTFLESGTSNSVGFCYDHTKYLYDSNGDNTPDMPLPPCGQLELEATGMDPSNPLTYWGAKDLGCVDSMLGGAGMPMIKRPDIRLLRGVSAPRSP